MTFTNAIPIECSTPLEGQVIGAAALASCGGETYLLTSAHTPLGTQPTANWVDWAPSVRLHLSSGHIDLPLFRESSFGARVPLFGYARPTHGALLHDTMWLPLAPDARVALEAEYPTFELREDFRINTVLTAYGYPAQGGPFPPDPTPRCSGTATGFNGAVLETTLPLVPGYSGGPVLDELQQLVGITIGKSGTIGQVSPANAIWRIVTEWKSKLTP